jgi:uncharacterized protein with PIN domain
MLVEQECARVGCDIFFVKTRHNMKYCSNKCCRLAANAKILSDYHDRKNWLAAENRRCAKCNKSLSRYNKDKVCNACQVEKRDLLDSNITSIGSVLSG